MFSLVNQNFVTIIFPFRKGVLRITEDDFRQKHYISVISAKGSDVF